MSPPPRPVRAVVFDMDGILADTEPLHFEAAREVFTAAGVDYTWEMNHEFFGRTTAAVFEAMQARQRLPGTVATHIAAYDAAVDYAQNRQVFGRAVADYELTRVKLGRMAVVIQAARQFAYAVARLMAAGGGAMEASMVKAYVCKAAEWVTREAMQIHGGYGYAEEYPVSRLYVDARVLSIFEGADEVLCLRVIARRLTERVS